MSDHRHLLVIDRLIERLEGPLPVINQGSVFEASLLQLSRQERNILVEYLAASRKRDNTP